MQLPVEDLIAILPFIIAAVGGISVILLDIFTPAETNRTFLGAFSLVFLGAMAISAAVNFDAVTHRAFFDTVISDDLSRFLTVLFSIAAALGVMIAMGRLPETGALRGEFYALLLFATGGASLLVQATDMITLFIGLETLSIPAYILAAAHRDDRRSIEAGFKYFILGAFSSGFLVYGIALLFGTCGGTGFDDIGKVAQAGWTENPYLVVGVLMVLTGFLFKIGAAPFHMWAPDVYQGAPTTATAFFATAVKAAAFTVLIRFLFVAIPDMRAGEGDFEIAGWWQLMAGFAVLTMFAANLTALVQTDVKRILSFSSIAHAGYLFIGLLVGKEGVAAILFYLLAYTFMTAGAFALVAYFEKKGTGTALKDYRGLGKRSPIAAICLCIFLFSLAGIPPTAGFFGKFYLFKVAVDAGLTGIVIIAVINSAISAFYYLKVIVAMYMQEEEGAPTAMEPSIAIAFAVAICLFFVLAMGIFPMPYLEAAKASIASLF